MKDTDPSASSTRQNPSPVPAPSDGGNASEQPNAGQQPGSWYATAMREHDRANAAELDRNAAAQRASSWWETSKTLNRAWKGANAMRASDAWLNRETRRQCDQVQLHLGPLYNDDHHSWSVAKLAEKAAADIASGTKRDTTVDSGTMGAMARIIIQAGEERRRADAAEAKLREVSAERGIIASGYRERVAERDADRAKLDEIREALDNRLAYPSPAYAFAEIRAIVERTTTEPELGDVIKCQRCGQQSQSISRGCSNCGLGCTTTEADRG